MNGQDSKAEIFDVFLCHNSEDKPAVREIAQKLVKEGIKPWLDEEQIRPGTSWQTALGEQIESIKSAAVFVGDSGIGPWQNRGDSGFSQPIRKAEMSRYSGDLAFCHNNAGAALDAGESSLRRFPGTDSQPLKRLIWGITGQKPAELSDVHSSDKPATMQERLNSPASRR